MITLETLAKDDLITFGKTVNLMLENAVFRA
jgi:hypothetical protein